MDLENVHISSWKWACVLYNRFNFVNLITAKNPNLDYAKFNGGYSPFYGMSHFVMGNY